MQRREFIMAAAASAIAGSEILASNVKNQKDFIDIWQRETDEVKPNVYGMYLKDGDTRGLASLEKLENGFEKAVAEARKTVITTTPAVWSIYNMGYLIKTKKSMFAIDLIHRRGLELAKELDFLLITHNHGDHFNGALYYAMNRSHKTVISNFLDNYGVKDWRKQGGFTRAKKIFKINDVEIRTSLIDHNSYLIDFTTAFEIRVGNWTMYHTGDSGHAGKLETIWGAPNLWTFFPGCGINVTDAVKRIKPKKLVFGHLWELGHKTGRLNAPLIRRAQKAAIAAGYTPTVALWGERIS